MADILVHADPHDHGHAVIVSGPPRFVMTSAQTTLLYSGIGLGVLCLILSFFFDDTEFHTRFWTNWLHNSVLLLGASFMAFFMLAAGIIMYAGWHIVFKRVWEAFAQFLPVAIGLMVPIVLGVWFHFNHIYHWADIEAVEADVLLDAKAGFLNPVWYTIAVLGIVSVWYFGFVVPLRRLSIEEDVQGTRDFSVHTRMRRVSGIFLPVAAFTSAAVIWQVIMSIDAHWYSTMFAWYATASWLVTTIGLTIIVLVYLKSLGYFPQVTEEHLHDLGKYLFAFSIFWSYLWFSQFMLIWYGNIGEETVYFKTRMEEFPVLFWGNLFLNFLLPFLVLMPNVTKRKFGVLTFVAIMVVFGHWVDFFQMIKPGTLHTAMEAALHVAPTDPTEVIHAANGPHHGGGNFVAGFTIPGLLEIGTFIGFLSLFFLVVLNALTKADLIPVGDPYLEESLHHHV